MRPSLLALLAMPVLAACATARSSGETSAVVDGRRLLPGTDSLLVYLVRDGDTVRTGLVVDELRVVDDGGRRMLQRVYRTSDQALGHAVDTLVDEHQSLGPVRHRSRRSTGIEMLDFAAGRVTGWTRQARGDSTGIDVALPAGVYNASSFDLVLRAAPLADGWQTVVPVFLSTSRSIVHLPARVTGREIVAGAPAWRVEADFDGMPVTFWVDTASRALRQQVMRVQPGIEVLFRAAANRPPSRGG